MDITPSRQFSKVVSICLLVSIFVACQSASLRTAPPSSHPLLSQLQGTWQGHGPGGPCAVTISGNLLTYTQPSSDPEKPGFWYRTTLTLILDTDPKQLHATIVDNIHEADIGTVVITLFKLDGEMLTLGVVDHVEEPPDQPLISDWDLVRDRYYLRRGDTPDPSSK